MTRRGRIGRKECADGQKFGEGRNLARAAQQTPPEPAAANQRSSRGALPKAKAGARPRRPDGHPGMALVLAGQTMGAHQTSAGLVCCLPWLARCSVASMTECARGICSVSPDNSLLPYHDVSLVHTWGQPDRAGEAVCCGPPTKTEQAYLCRLEISLGQEEGLEVAGQEESG